MNETSAATATDIKVTVVIIGRNEEQFIGRSIESSLAAADGLTGAAERAAAGLEVIFVDSASTDRSVEIATGYPIRVLQLRPEWPLCVAAGRYTGLRHSRGQYVLFLDGDAEIEADWLHRAVAFMDAHPHYGAIAGVLDEHYVDAQGHRHGGQKNVFGQDTSREQVDCKSLGGIAMYRRRALEQAGPVNPHLPTGEDDELCLRLRNAGFQLARIRGRMAIKYTERRDTLHEVLRRSRTRMYDYGAVIRYSSLYGGGIQYCRDAIPYVVSFAVTALLLMLALPVAIYTQTVLWWIAALVLLAAAVVVKKRSVHRALLSVLVRAVSTLRTIISFVRTKPQPVEAYPTDVIHVR